MKSKILILVVLLLTVNVSFGQSKSSRKFSVQKTYIDIMDIINQISTNPDDEKAKVVGKYYSLAPYILYMGKDDVRHCLAECAYEKEEDKKRTDKLGLILTDIVNLSSDYEFGDFSFLDTPEGKWHILEIYFDKRNNEYQKKAEFAFLKVKSYYLLGSIEIKNLTDDGGQ
ncbi:MAG: hypothetical protein KKA07_13030 [Bacteroidetes bacterium]|nr:hypothetical protein [Bacteroidota bacterium]MBU1719982.1 hypothetical protein [Bacteroidota bacterium]